MKILEKQINTLLDREAKMWAQRSKIQWPRTLASSTVKLHSGDGEIISKAYMMKRANGVLI